MTTRTDLAALLLSRLTHGPASVGMLIAHCLASVEWMPLRSEVEKAMGELVAKGKAQWWPAARCWSVAGGVLTKKGEE